MAAPASKVLVVDDSSIVLRVLSRQLRQAGYQVAVTSKAFGLLQTILAERPTLLVLDIEMPGLQIGSLCRMLQKHSGRDLPVLLHSGLEEAELADVSLRFGADGYIQKGWSLERKLAVLKTLESNRQGPPQSEIEHPR